MSQWRGNWKWNLSTIQLRKNSVTQHVPMKRELKERESGTSPLFFLSYTACPNEEGTERRWSLPAMISSPSLHSMSQWRGNWKSGNFRHMSKAQSGYTACPNEEGTERHITMRGALAPNGVTQHVPMKRELKVGLRVVYQRAKRVTQHVPMKRELKVHRSL